MNYARLKNIKKLCFGYEEISKVLGITPASARVSASRYVKYGILLRLKRNNYILRDRWDSLTRDEKFAVANIIQVPSYISLMTALDYHDITTQMQRDFIESVAIRRTKEVKILDTVMNFTKINGELYFDFVKEKGFFIATPEKAFMDAIYLMSLKRYSFDLSSIDRGNLDMGKVKAIAKRFPEKTKEVLRKYGYITKT